MRADASAMALRVSDTTTYRDVVGGVGQVDFLPCAHHEHLRAMVDGVLAQHRRRISASTVFIDARLLAFPFGHLPLWGFEMRRCGVTSVPSLTMAL